MKKLLLVSLILLCGGCNPSALNTPATQMPVGAKIIEDLGHGWLIFEVRGRQFIYLPYGPDGAADGRYAVLAPWNPAP